MKHNILITQKIIIIITTILILFVSGCGNENIVSTPTLNMPSDHVTSIPTANIEPTNSPLLDDEEEIIFNDLNLEHIVRGLIGKNIGSVTRKDVSGITRLSARVRGISNIDALRYFTSLEELDLYGNRISDLSPLANLVSLKKLNLGKNYNVLTPNQTDMNGLDISELKALIMLEELDLSDNMIQDISALSSLVNLQKLILCDNRIEEILVLSGCSKLKYVDLSNNYGLNADNSERGIKDISPLYSLNMLEIILCSNNLILDVQGIEALSNAKYIDLSGNFIQTIESFAKMEKLNELILRMNFISTIEPLKNNVSIKHLDVTSNMITDFSPINSMKALEKLGWENNNIQDFTQIDIFEEKIKKS